MFDWSVAHLKQAMIMAGMVNLLYSNFLKLWEKTKECAPQVLNLSFKFLQVIFFWMLWAEIDYHGFLTRYKFMLKPKVEEDLNRWISDQSLTPLYISNLFFFYFTRSKGPLKKW